MNKYVLGFIFSHDQNRVLLIQKNHPSWQAGKYNGIGGHIEEGEEPIDAMIRECREECGLNITFHKWKGLGIQVGADYSIHIFTVNTHLNNAKQTTKEKIIITSIDKMQGLDLVDRVAQWVSCCIDPTIPKSKVN